MTAVRVHNARGVDEQQRTIDAWLRETDNASRAVLIESGFGSLAVPENVPLVRLFSGCVCCVGTVALRVALVRLLRIERPDQLLLILSDDAHLDRVRSLLTDGTLGVRLVLSN